MTPSHRASLARQAAIRLLSWFPGPWRARYQREMQALLEDMPVRWLQVANLASTCMREWLSPRALGWPARTAAGRINLARYLTFATFAYALDGIARVAAWYLLDAGVTVQTALLDDLAWVKFAILLRIAVAAALRTKVIQRSRWARSISRRSWLAYLRDWEVVAWLVVTMPGLIVGHMLPTPAYLKGTMAVLEPYMEVYNVWMWTYVLLMTSHGTARIRRIYLASFKRIGKPRAYA